MVVDVGPVISGTGTIALTSPSFPKGADDYTDGDPITQVKYLMTKEQALGNLVFTFTPAGTMLKGSTVILTLPDGGTPPWANVVVDGGCLPAPWVG